MQWLWIALGGASGTLLRYQVTRLIGIGDFPWATLIINLCGSFIIGGFYVLSQHISVSSELRGALQIGLLGAFTTFSTLTLELLLLLEDGRLTAALGYAVASLTGGVGAALAGWHLASLAAVKIIGHP